ncbi:MAG: hypothetical protein L3J74_08985 [Bacteroidales bacterium]|nr:hypothetical protein [Bacteroidales bacterium]
MKKLSLSIVLFLFASFTFGQNIGSYLESQQKVLKKEKNEIVKDVLELNNDEAKVFWPIYDQYMHELKPYNQIFVNTIKEYIDKYDHLSDEDAKKLFNNTIIVEESKLRLKKKYYRKMVKVLPPQKVIRYFQLEKRLWAMIYNELTIEIPLIGD